MKWIETRVIFESTDREFASDLISSLFYDFGLMGVVIEDPDLNPEEGWSEDAVKKPEYDAVTGYLPDNAAGDEKRSILEKRLRRLKAGNNIFTRVLYRKIDEEDWAESWKAYFWPERICGHIVVKPTWREYDSKPEDIVIEIDPGMAFGTGTHPTTALSISLIDKYILKNDSFLDIGTGSGILMIAAAKLGAGKVVGVDTDDIAVGIAEKNLKLNRIPNSSFIVKTGDLAYGVMEKFDLVVANILADVIIVLLDSLKHVIKKRGLFICSGIIEEKKDDVIRKMDEQGLSVMEILSRESWIAVAGRMN